MKKPTPLQKLLLLVLPARIRIRVVSFGLICGTAALLLTVLAIVSIGERRLDIIEARSFASSIERAVLLLRNSQTPIETVKALNRNGSDALRYRYLENEKAVRTAFESDYALLSFQFRPDLPVIMVASAATPVRTALFRASDDLSNFHSALSHLSAALVRQDSEGHLIVLVNGRALSISSPTHWTERTTEVEWFLILFIGLITIGASYLTVTRWFLRSFRLLGEGIRPDDPDELPLVSREARNIITQLRRQEQEKAETVADRTRMLTAISHDLRTPATKLRLRAEMIEDRTLRHKILGDLDLMLGMLNESIDFLRGNVTDEPLESYDLLSLIESICDDFSDVGEPVTLLPVKYPSLHTTGTVFSANQSSLPLDQLFRGHMIGRPKALKRALDNLISNAIKYGFQAKVLVSIETDRIEIDITDRGPGIPEDSMEEVFKPFFRLEKSRNRETGGSGLGLSIAQSIVHSMQGSIELINETPQGLRVRVTLPKT
ncbi:sensor histidine kinase [Kiloniella sp. b19]|uniref:sensor histidine kinase n=1 Tax=Kiloniella sp. GXU_MW_B19 TaxID=3141326 RepID=UPI0031D1DCD2